MTDSNTTISFSKKYQFLSGGTGSQGRAAVIIDNDSPVRVRHALRDPVQKDHLVDAGICGTGDNFVTDGQMREWNVVDMEAYALAKVCALENIRFGCLKFITDGIDGHAAATWEAALTDASRALREAFTQISMGS